MQRPPLLLIALLILSAAPALGQPAAEGSGLSGTSVEALGGSVGVSLDVGGSLDARPSDGSMGGSGSVGVSTGIGSVGAGLDVSLPTGGQRGEPESVPVGTTIGQASTGISTQPLPTETEEVAASTCSDTVSGRLMHAAEIVPIGAESAVAIVPLCDGVSIDGSGMAELAPLVADNARLADALATAGHDAGDVVAITSAEGAIVLYVPQG
ncbi:hypothetical protein EMQ25_06835 [Arsenicitalea aurantiaca]|uniref:Uncharacterized protein n=1 Tax=Arsenicitalea aurantiaca TaxID=1783274 RepID=A0A433XFX1_9HYPH|nr:hypothetical protein [Arsenicitalea aurantiaca]RUT32848.1 hypothetical protein EMQ25_06835 [Arsenicitalea aurantiaca]